MAEEKLLSRQIIFAGRALSLHVDTVVKADGRSTTREIVEHAPVIAVIAVADDGQVLLVRQFREAVAKEMLEVPAGGIEPGESPEEAVRREMQEETGFVPGKIERLSGFYAAPGYCTEYLSLYLASDLKPSRLLAEDTEGIVVIKVAAKQVTELIKSGKIEDAKSIAGLLLYLEMLKTA